MMLCYKKVTLITVVLPQNYHDFDRKTREPVFNIKNSSSLSLCLILKNKKKIDEILCIKFYFVCRLDKFLFSVVKLFCLFNLKLLFNWIIDTVYEEFDLWPFIKCPNSLCRHFIQIKYCWFYWRKSNSRYEFILLSFNIHRTKCVFRCMGFYITVFCLGLFDKILFY